METMVTTLRVSKDLKKLPMEELLGTLKFHEMELNEDEGQLKGKIKMEEQFQEAHQGNEKQEEEEKEKKKPFIKKKKSLMATWEDLDLSSLEDEDEEANLCLMADTTSEDEDDEKVNFNNLEYLEIVYQELLSNSSTLPLEYKELKRKFSKLTKDFESLEKENSILKKENEKLKEEQTNYLSKVNTSKVTELQKELLKYSRSPHDKSSLGFEKEKENKRKTKFHCSNYRKFRWRSYDCRECPKGLSKPLRTNPKKIWKKTTVMVLGQWMLTKHDGRRVYVRRPPSKEKRMSYLRRIHSQGLQYSIVFSTKRQNNLYKIDLANLTNQNVTCLKLGHASLRLISKLKKHNHMGGLPSLVYKAGLLCDACQKGKQIID
ncbi:hypothetical protein CR513_20506, partial [Mucuna pruriens]